MRQAIYLWLRECNVWFVIIGLSIVTISVIPQGWDRNLLILMLSLYVLIITLETKDYIRWVLRRGRGDTEVSNQCWKQLEND